MIRSVAEKAICLAAALAGLAACAGGERVVLAEWGVAKAKIVIANRATRAAQFAAKELKWHLDRMTGAEWEIIELSNNRIIENGKWIPIYVGESEGTVSKNADFGSQQYKVEVRPGRWS